jgi:hypothetical protein
MVNGRTGRGHHSSFAGLDIILGLVIEVDMQEVGAGVMSHQGQCDMIRSTGSLGCTAAYRQTHKEHR